MPLSNSRQGLLIFILMCLLPFKFQNIPTRFHDQFTGDEKNPIFYCLYGLFNLLLFQYLFFEYIHQIISNHQKPNPRIILATTMGNNLIYTTAIYHLFNDVLAASPLVVHLLTSPCSSALMAKMTWQF